ncbi:tRNA (guanine-N1)-methyltransferase [Desulfocapsa sulfexigens DSM 10523]|uniref:tRNA (guanine-N(1)-)-methyltransferase n=1 Tax=Desulfocapsa sulfexigens (strain DSM 10523 / SB164P1) TaxID=1167006 RepID=M1P8S3_DESSD|nr:tRNA (guanosine(37)-N1)-methyltransferase TrmD [Desulfocapsa sulfexigens]AGF79873.1 tRNA (guanine-N1)-methyltransferase [Desulfocapsa sulfexigens DSM 10523]
MIFDILTIFPDLLESPLNEAIIRRAREADQVHIEITNIRDFATDRHSMTDDRPFGGGEGMVMKPEPLSAALASVNQKNESGRVVLLSPQGRQYTQEIARELSREKHLILVCGRYEGVDERFRSASVDDELSIGDYILTGGELAAMVIIDSVTRLLPGVLGCADSAKKDTFSRRLLKHPQYTRPRVFEGREIPEILLSGDHAKIEEYRFVESVKRTLDRRPDLLRKEFGSFSRIEAKLLRKHQLYDIIKALQEQ